MWFTCRRRKNPIPSDPRPYVTPPLALIGFACLLFLNFETSKGGTCQQTPKTASMAQQRTNGLLRMPAALLTYLHEDELENGQADIEGRIPSRLRSHLQSGAARVRSPRFKFPHASR